MAHDYNFSLIFYPQTNGAYTVICPELPGCVTEGDTVDEAMESARELIADLLPDQISREVNEETLREGLCMEGKFYHEVKATVDDSGEVIFHSTAKAERVAV
ncbi:MAG: type II toxin-antitoxin system HicB family antitoxin [Synergistaceae bacterium]|nr:type II toxin-antitoxin system HicB family antitoxin [Synergistaceae bacterium]